MPRPPLIVDDYEPYYLQPPHEVRDGDKLARLTDSMRRRGWQGRPLLIRRVGDGWQALTGSHRIAAARAAELETVPALAIDYDDLTDEQWEEIGYCRDTEDYLAVLGRCGRRLRRAVTLLNRELRYDDAEQTA